MGDQVAANYIHAYFERHPVRKYKKGEIIFFQGEVPRHAYVIKTGVVKAYNLSASGDEKPIAFYGTDHVFPTAWVYNKASSSIYFYEAFTSELELYVVPREEFINFIKKRPQLLFQEFEKALSDRIGASLRLNALQHSKASEKLIYTLHYLAITHGHPNGKSNISIELNLTHQDFANLTGLTRETVATELNRLKREQVIDYSKNKPYKVDLKKLLKLLNDQFIADLKLG